ncbi:DUF3237 domain-containing protein [Luteimonas sp. RIT-PG2_3]|jgi:hypothetical protein
MGAGLELEHIFDIRCDFDMRLTYGPMVGDSHGGFTRVGSGTITGPRLNGRLVPQGGGDWATIRADGVIDLSAHYLLEADDGTTIYIHNRGYLIPGKRNAETGRTEQPSYFRFTPVFKVPVGPHDWLARTVVVGTGVRHWDPDHTVFSYYAVK